MNKPETALVLEKNLTVERIAFWRDALLGALASGAPLSLNFSGLTRLDLAGLQLLVGLLREADARSQSVRFTGTVCENCLQAFISAGIDSDCEGDAGRLEKALRLFVWGTAPQRKET